jgi:Kef-type K+ transport system membrane component KefB
VAFLLGRGLTVSFFYGLVFAATSVSISVQVLQEYGKLKSRAGNIILGAAVVDDILAILLLAFFTSGEKSGESLLPKLGLQLLFFVFLIFVHFIIPRVWGMVERLPIFAKNTAMALILCLWLSLLANSVGISSVIGAFFAGLAISQTKPADVIRDNIAMIASVVFEPLFFVSLGISVSLASLIKTPGLILLFVALAIFTKFLPAYYVSRLMGTDRSNSLLIGTGMVSRGEMALIIVQLGLTSHIISDEVYSELVLVIILATFLAPFLMKASLQAKKLDK